MNGNLVPSIVSGASALLVGIFGGGTVAALFRVRADRQQVVVEAAQGAVVVQTGVIDDLTEELTRLKGDLADLRADAERARREIQDLQERAAAATQEAVALKRENDQLRARVAELEQAVAR